jgi:hypothetical protein
VKNSICKSLPILTVCALAFFALPSASAQEQSHAGHDHAGHDHDGHDHSDHAHSGESLAFQLTDWKSMHFDDANKAAQHAATVKKLGCEVKQDNHAGHIDVTYRSAQWKEMQVKNHNMAEQWENWLSKSGFDVSHSHPDPAYAKGPEAVEFRLVKWKSMHGDGSANEKQFVTTLQQLGCEVRMDKHDGHADIAFRAPTWRDVHVADHGKADQLMGWLNQNGFEVRHEH